MIVLCKDTQLIEQALEYIGTEYKAVPYCYVNLKKYGLESKVVKVWVDMEENRVRGIYLLYYDCLHFVTFDMEYPYAELFAMVETVKPRVVMLQGAVGERVESLLDKEFDVEKNHVIGCGENVKAELSHRVEKARREDLEGIAELMISDKEYKDVYQKKTLIQQFCSRFDDGFSRNFIIRENDEIAAVFCTYGEVEGFAITGGLMVHPAHRRKGLGKEISSHLYEVLRLEGVEIIGFVNFHNTPSLILHENLGTVPIASLYKFVRKSR